MSPHSILTRSGPMDVQDSQYGYLPHEWIAIIFVVLYGISLALHVGQATYYRMWWLFPTACLCGLGEVVGWSGRLWSSISPSLYNPFLMQIVSTIIAPTPLIAVNFILLSWVVTRLGPCYARLTPIQYAILFISCDILALVIQAAGGAIASSAVTLAGANMGAHIMLAGIVVQFGGSGLNCCAVFADHITQLQLSHTPTWHSISCFAISHDRPLRLESRGRGVLDGNLQTMIGALAFSTLLLFIRGIYRIIELAGGWHGRVLHTEVYFNVLDGGMVVLAILIINFAHPGRLLGSQRPSLPENYAGGKGDGGVE
ncbi:RTA1 like protein-domain-containing protein [Mycena alexandri]|uniref:RTA1 like protein-domain-containing protein n=1 Tax=Mycena alexandri TaxID=1745969 RepID=A0AAD6SGU7_9AGAR|nr:RTA1 like protein-domain-containing protein [Mycena alexandri]